MLCPYCSYSWTPRKADPVACPKCKRRLDQLPEKHKEKEEARDLKRTVLLISGTQQGKGEARTVALSGLTPVNTDQGVVYLLSVEDYLIERIKAAKQRGSQADREEAVKTADRFKDSIDWKYLEKMCKQQNTEDMLKEVLEESR